MAKWQRFEHNGLLGFGTLQDGSGRLNDVLAGGIPADQSGHLSAVRGRAPFDARKVVFVGNNFHETRDQDCQTEIFSCRGRKQR